MATVGASINAAAMGPTFLGESQGRNLLKKTHSKMPRRSTASGAVRACCDTGIMKAEVAVARARSDRTFILSRLLCLLLPRALDRLRFNEG